MTPATGLPISPCRETLPKPFPSRKAAGVNVGNEVAGCDAADNGEPPAEGCLALRRRFCYGRSGIYYQPRAAISGMSNSLILQATSVLLVARSFFMMLRM